MKQQSKREPGPSSPLIKRAWSYKYIYLMMLPGLIYFLLFHYVPMLGTGIGSSVLKTHFSAGSSWD